VLVSESGDRFSLVMALPEACAGGKWVRSIVTLKTLESPSRVIDTRYCDSVK
jgi:hypothetical protein